jgi:hypothetical protein
MGGGRDVEATGRESDRLDFFRTIELGTRVSSSSSDASSIPGNPGGCANRGCGGTAVVPKMLFRCPGGRCAFDKKRGSGGGGGGSGEAGPWEIWNDFRRRDKCLERPAV